MTNQEYPSTGERATEQGLAAELADIAAVLASRADALGRDAAGRLDAGGDRMRGEASALRQLATRAQLRALDARAAGSFPRRAA